MAEPPVFANFYWSPDYASGIGKLACQLRISLGQLHELRQYVHCYVEVHHNTGSALCSASKSANAIDSAFRLSRGQREVKRLRKVSGNKAQHLAELDMDYVYRQFTLQTAIDLKQECYTAARIERLVLEPLTQFIKVLEPQVRSMISTLSDQLGEYEALYSSLEAAKAHYDSIERAAEFQRNSEAPLLPIKDCSDISRVSDESGSETLNSEKSEDFSVANTRDFEAIIEQNDIETPFVLAPGVRFDDATALVSFLRNLVARVPVTQRKVHIPGFRDEIFSSEDLAKSLLSLKLRGFTPSRASIERAGQMLLNARLMVGTGLFAKRFKSEDMWFEWSAATMDIVGADESARERSFQSTKTKLDEAFNTMTLLTSKTLTGVFKSMSSSIGTQKATNGALDEAEAAYNAAYESLHLCKHKLEVLIYETSAKLQQFEKLKIDVVFDSLLSLRRILQLRSEKIQELFNILSDRIDSDMDFPRILQHELRKTFENFSTGMYFPSLIPPDSNPSSSSSIAPLQTNFQNVKLSFNLYKDIPLQLKVSEAKKDAQEITQQSVPLFLNKVVEYLDNFSKEQLQEAWLLMNHQDAWLVKDEIIYLAQDYSKVSGLNRTDNHDTELAILEGILKKMKNFALERLLNYFKYWLLEISDSVIPSTVYDSLIKHYSIKDGIERPANLVKILGTVPRSNLGSLVRLLKHISSVYELDEKKDAGEVVAKLNLMSSIWLIPFLHIIMRPSVLKNTAGFKPPLDEYNAILLDLLKASTIQSLEAHLIILEEQFSQRQKQHRKLFDKQLMEARARSTSVTSEDAVSSADIAVLTPTKSVDPNAHVLPKTPKSLGAGDGEQFSLRPFRTGNTPRPSPMTSPVEKWTSDRDPPVDEASVDET